jgi:hypothetical protein
MYDDDPQVVSLFLPCTTSIRLAHDVIDRMAEHPIEPLGEHKAPILLSFLLSLCAGLRAEGKIGHCPW